MFTSIQGKSQAELKLLCILLHFSFNVILSLVFFSVASTQSTRVRTGLTNYFTCEAFGVNPDDPCILEVDRTRDQALTTASRVVYATVPYVTLIYIVPVEKVKTAFMKRRIRSKSSDSTQQVRSV